MIDLVRVEELLDRQACASACLLARDPLGECTCRCRGRYHGEGLAAIGQASSSNRERRWHFYSRSGWKRSEYLSLFWEIAGDPITDDYLPDEITAYELLQYWVRRYGRRSETVEIYWSVGPVHEAAWWTPIASDCHFLAFYTWPIDDDGNRLRWADLPVVDKRWCPGRGDKGGFFQEATGWKPSPMQTSVHWPTILQSAGFSALTEAAPAL